MSEQNSQKQQADKNNAPASLVVSFHRAKSLIPSDQELITIPPEMRVAEALKLMQKNRYSQLPVVAGQAVLGIFSYRSFSAKVLAKQKSSKESLGELPVEDFLEDFEYAHANDDWSQVLRYLDQDDACFVGHRNGLEGLVTTMDMLSYFRVIANPFILIAEIELSLRQIIQTCIADEHLPEALEKSLRTAYPKDKIPTDLNEMTFDNYVQIISNNDNWPYFKDMFGYQERTRKQTNQKLRQLGEWRNMIFHFRRQLEDWELKTLAEHRDWLHRRVRAFEGRHKAKAQQKSESTSRLTKRKWDEPSFFTELETRSGSKDVSVARDILAWAQQRMTYVWWGEGKRNGSFVPTLNHNGTDYQLFAVWTSGGVEIYFQWLQGKPPFDSEAKRLELLRRLNDLPDVSLPKTTITKRPSIYLSTLYDETSRRQFLEILDWVVREIQTGGDY